MLVLKSFRFQQMLMNATDDDAIEGLIKYDKAEIMGSGKGSLIYVTKLFQAT